jgi:hypothetical protein
VLTKKGDLVVLELKVCMGSDAVLTSHIATIKKNVGGEKKVRGIIIAHDFSDRLVKAASLIENLKLMKYKVRFDFEAVQLSFFL